jgi:hypothetical protein
MGLWLELGSAIGSVSFSLDLLVLKKVFPTIFSKRIDQLRFMVV